MQEVGTLPQEYLYKKKHAFMGQNNKDQIICFIYYDRYHHAKASWHRLLCYGTDYYAMDMIARFVFIIIAGIPGQTRLGG